MSTKRMAVMIIKVLVVLGLCTAAVILVLFFKHQNERREKMYNAAGDILRNELLDEALKNPYLLKYSQKDIGDQKLMINFRILNSKPQKSYVFNPEQAIGIGRSKNENKIALTDPTISSEQCKVYLKTDRIVLEDCYSLNGTIVKRGFNKYPITNGQSIVLENNDTLIFGSVQIKVRLFVYDMIWM